MYTVITKDNYYIICHNFITLRLSCVTLYCNRSCLFVGVCLWLCYHYNSKLRAWIFTKLGL